ncbi:MAG: phosphonate C-P lyase system protein PhnH [Gracilibacteraceae bacterium]|jgi:alpha-D-ribose 1-methylphosphonate 5-triphosphate synthase subunit PhnH|nr:phosphonate C-P lyase system protein PhnH [Gracilibacteraceae bacterium]
MISTLSKKHSFDAVFDSQRVFRLILEAVSNPARTVGIGEYAAKLSGVRPAMLAVAMTLLDNEVSFNTCGNDALSGEIASLTLAKKGEIETADFVFVSHLDDIKDAIENMKCGTLSDPHRSATAIIRNEGVPSVPMKVSGPGIEGRVTVHVTRTAVYAAALRDGQNYEYPCGIDMFFLSDNGELLAIPRLTRMEAE